MATKPSCSPAAVFLRRPTPSHHRHQLRLVLLPLPVEGIDEGRSQEPSPHPSSPTPAAPAAAVPDLLRRHHLVRQPREHESEMEVDNATEQYNSVDSQGKP
ncbi:uncharacterized protein [Lolium perenne]|uniref:uncharacterized protein n=1 Tax=Lolium perenne TaxID=4522 RepID=UPI0021F63A4B|nr:uncharacterized protein LOC127306896 [Lolium perenne]